MYQKNHYYRYDPVFDMVMVNKIPFFWDVSKHHDFTANQVKVLCEAKDFDIRLGVTIPLCYATIFQSSLTILDVKDLHDEVLGNLIAAGQIYLEKIDQFDQPLEYIEDHNPSFRLMINDILLTPRESEILLLLMRGYTSKEVANSINISRRTVEFYLDNVKKKT